MMATKNGSNNPFMDFLDTDPAVAYYSSPRAQAFMLGMPSEGYDPIDPKDAGVLGSQGRQRFFRNQYEDAYSEYLGSLGQQIRGGTAPTGSFADYLSDYPFTERYAALTPQQAGRTTNRYSPSTRHIYF
jgi:hypothetical protein